jgi:hypothetical protein
MPCPRDPLTCIHRTTGLCPACREEYLADPSAWLEYGHHAAGLENWQRLPARRASAGASALK